MAYNINYGIAPYLKEKLIYDVRNIPFCFKFDETTNQQVQQQYDAYLQYWSKSQSKITNAYCDSLFVGHSTSDNLLNHFNSFMKDLNLDYNHLIQVGMDGPNVNLSFEKKLRSIMETTYETSFLNFGTCSLHPVHTAFRKGIKKLDFDVDEFFHDIHFFFKLSSARREDYPSLEETTKVAAPYALQHSETRWLNM